VSATPWEIAHATPYGWMDGAAEPNSTAATTTINESSAGPIPFVASF
jgi:hypothetical protein